MNAKEILDCLNAGAELEKQGFTKDGCFECASRGWKYIELIKYGPGEKENTTQEKIQCNMCGGVGFRWFKFATI